jgi:signal transduction histidine kinase
VRAERRARRALPGRLSAWAARVGPVARRVAAGPDWPLASALALGLAAALETLLRTGLPLDSDASTALLLNLLATVPLALRRRWLPVAAVVVTAATVAAVSSTSAWTVAGLFGQVVVLYLVAARYPRRVLLLVAVPFLLVALGTSGQGAAVSGVLLLVLAGAALAVGDASRLRGQAIAERDRSRRAAADALRDRAAVHERARIARELHDVVAHHVSMIAVQAEAARLATAGMPEEGRRRLEAIGATAREALTEMRRLLAVLRADAGGEADRAPQPGLDRLDQLLGSARAAGTRCRLTLRGQAVPLPPGVDLAAYRILQEALTNARRHAPGATVEVELCYAAGAVHLRVRDDGPGAAAPGAGGHGLLGMRERAAMAGGTLRAGAAAGGGFVVEAVLPTAGPVGGAASLPGPPHGAAPTPRPAGDQEGPGAPRGSGGAAP